LEIGKRSGTFPGMLKERTFNIVWVSQDHGAGIPIAEKPDAVVHYNPIIQTIYTADPAPVVHDGVCYLYTDHDEDVLVKNFFTMKDWRCFTSTDMVNWTDHGVVASLRNFKWADPKISGWGGFDNGAWALQTIERDGKWYMYCPLQGRGIGVLVADNPFGPFTDPIGKPLIGGKYDSIDPTVFIDDDGQAYLCWGNPRCWYVKLNKDMISYDTSIGDQGLVVQDMTVGAFGKRSKDDPQRLTTYEEGPWLYKRKRTLLPHLCRRTHFRTYRLFHRPQPQRSVEIWRCCDARPGTAASRTIPALWTTRENLFVLPQWRPAWRRWFPSFRLCGRDEV
jgi:hypothetical protein